MKLICLCAFRNPGPLLKDFVAHLRDDVDGFIFLDDRSAPNESLDASAWLALEPKVLGLIKRSARTSAAHAFEARSRRILCAEAIAEGADWFLCLDVDERLERGAISDFMTMAGISTSVRSYGVQVRDLWDSLTQYRVDGIWGKKRKPIFFHKSCACPGNGLHDPWFFVPRASHFELSANLYHLGSLTWSDREYRRQKFKEIDPTGTNGGFGYDYLSDSSGLIVETIPEGREWKTHNLYPASA